MPDRIEVEGIEFVEFAADEAEAEVLSGMFEALGFLAHRAARLQGRHTLWRQGGINLVINTEREGFSHSSYLVHGTSVCDIGLKVADAAATVARARALGADTFEQPAGPGELKIPAIRGVGGGVMHFIDDTAELARVWETEFRPAGGGAGGGLRRPYPHRPSGADDELRGDADLDALLHVDLRHAEDAHGRVWSTRRGWCEARRSRRRTATCASRSTGRRTGARLPAASSPKASARPCSISPLPPMTFSPAPPRSRRRGSGRWRFRATTMTTWKRGSASIPTSPNASGHGTFSTTGTERESTSSSTAPNYGEGFFFEVVERRGGYKGYGAANAPVPHCRAEAAAALRHAPAALNPAPGRPSQASILVSPQTEIAWPEIVRPCSLARKRTWPAIWRGVTYSRMDV